MSILSVLTSTRMCIEQAEKGGKYSIRNLQNVAGAYSYSHGLSMGSVGGFPL